MGESKCGAVGSACPDVSSFQVCDPSDQSDAWTGLKRLTILHKKPGSTAPEDNVAALLKPDAPLPERFSNPTLAEANDVLTNGYLQGNGFAGICRSPSITGETPDKWYAFQGHPGKAGKVVLFGDYNPAVNGTMFRVPIELSKAEAFGLVNALGLRELDIACEPGACVKDGSAAKGKYYFTADPTRLAWLLMQLADPTVAIPGMTQERRDAIIGQMFPLKEKGDQPTKLVEQQIDLGKQQGDFLKAQEKFARSQDNKATGQLIIALLLLAAIGYQPAKDVIAKLRGRVQMTDFGKYIEGLLELDPDYEVKGRMAEAQGIWRMADTTGYRHIIIDAPTGEGKDKVAEEMLILKARGDGSVPPGFQDAKVVKINAAEFQANTQFRGNVADKVAEIAKMARKGKVIVYVSEIDLIFLSGGSSSGDSEAVGKLLLDLVEDPAIKENLILLGTTSRGSEMLARYPDLQRRFNWPRIHSFLLKEVADVLLGPTTKMMTRAFGTTFDQPVVEVAAKLAEALYRPSTLKANPQTGVATMLPRIDAVKTILEDAAKIARAQKSAAVTVDHVVEAVQGRCGQSFNPAHIEALLQMDIDQVRVDSYVRVVQEAAAIPVPAEGGGEAAVPPPEAKETTPAPEAREAAPGAKEAAPPPEAREAAPGAKEAAPGGRAAEVGVPLPEGAAEEGGLSLDPDEEVCRVPEADAASRGVPESHTRAYARPLDQAPPAPPEARSRGAAGRIALEPVSEVQPPVAAVSEEAIDRARQQFMGDAEARSHIAGMSEAAQRVVVGNLLREWQVMSPGQRGMISSRNTPIGGVEVAAGIPKMPLRHAAERLQEMARRALSAVVEPGRPGARPEERPENPLDSRNGGKGETTPGFPIDPRKPGNGGKR